MTIISEVCFCANDHEGCYAILHRVHLVGLSSNFQLRVDVPAQELLRLGFDHVLREPRNIYAQQLRRCVRIDAFPIHSESHQRPPLVQVLPQANAKTRPYPAWSSASLVPSFPPRRLYRVPIMCRSRVPRMRQPKKHATIFPNYATWHAMFPVLPVHPHCTRSMNRRRAPQGSLSPSVHPQLRR